MVSVARISSILPALALAAVAQAQTARMPPSETPPDIVVNGQSVDADKRLVLALAPSRFHHQLSRWNLAICTRVYGLQPDYSDIIRHTVEDTARSVHIPVDTSAKCPSNIVIVFTPDADAMTERFIKAHSDLFVEPDHSQAARERIRALRVHRPVRWIAFDRTSMADDSPQRTSLTDSTQVRPSTLTRTKLQTRRDAALSYVIVDLHEISKASWRQLADYLALVALARPAPDASFPQTSIMALFGNAEASSPPSGMTAEDRGFLQGLYTSDPAQDDHVQRDAIRSAIDKARATVGR